MQVRDNPPQVAARHGACWRCSYFNPLSDDETVTEETGECRRYPPQASLTDEDEATALFPAVGWTDWCGEFRDDQCGQ